MSATVTLHVFSGRPNPRWLLNDAQSAELTSRIGNISETTNAKLVGPAGGLGYQGFSIQHHDTGRDLFVNAGAIDTGVLAPTLIAENREIESWLLSTAGSTIPEEARPHIQQSIGVPVSQAQSLLGNRFAKLGCPACHAVDAPDYNPSMWNTPAVQPHNNCYNYANNKITNSFAQPGLAHHQKYTSFQCDNVQAAAVADGLSPTPHFMAPLAAGQGWYVALVIWPNNDFHWYRQDKVGCWSHKPGSTAVRNTDNSGAAIADPKKCDRGPYTNFCTYMITNNSVVIR